MKVFTEKELGVELGVSPWTIRNWRLQGGLPHIRVRRRIFYRMESVEEWMGAKEHASNEDRSDTNFIVNVA